MLKIQVMLSSSLEKRLMMEKTNGLSVAVVVVKLDSPQRQVGVQWKIKLGGRSLDT
jgi:hypothetical protein